jgi:hypothetical protein
VLLSQEEDERDPISLPILQLMLTVMRGEEEIKATIEVEEVEAMITIVEMTTILEEETRGEITTMTGEEATHLICSEVIKTGVTLMIIVANEAVVVTEMTQGEKRTI